MNTKVSNKDVKWNYIGIIVSMISNFVMLPFMIHYLDSEILGLWYVFLSIGGIASLFDLGFTPTIARNIAYGWNGAEGVKEEGVIYSKSGEPNFELLAGIIKISRIIYLIISSTALLLMLTVGTLYISYLSKNIQDNTILVSWLIYAVAIFLNIYYGCYTMFLRGIGAVADYNKINVVARIIQIILSVILLFSGFGIIAVSMGYCFYGFVLRYFSKQRFLKYYGFDYQIRKYKNNITKSTLKDIFFAMWHNAWRDGLVTISNYLTSQAGTLIASAFLSLTETGIYSLTVQLITAILTISSGLYTAYQPTLQAAYVLNDKKLMREKMSIIMVVNLYVATFGVVVLMLFGPYIIKIIKPSLIINRPIIFATAVYLFLYKRQSIYASFISNMNTVPYCKSYIISSFGGIVLSVILMKYCHFGIWGMIVGQFIPQVLYNYWKWPKYVLGYLECSNVELIRIGNTGIGTAIRGKRK
jgi:O-antigen/teichoic acid export membrane protein